MQLPLIGRAKGCNVINISTCEYSGRKKVNVRLQIEGKHDRKAATLNFKAEVLIDVSEN